MPDRSDLNFTPAEGQTTGESSREKLTSGLWNALSWVRDLLFSMLIAVVSIVFIYQPVKVEGTSMEPGLQNEERIFINKFTYKFRLGSVSRGETVVFRAPKSMDKSYIKRVIGVPGDRVRIDHGQVYVNGKALVENYIKDDGPDYFTMDEETVPEGNYFVLGDHRTSSSDSRSWGFVPRENIYGKAVFVYWPPEKMGRLR